MHKLAKSLILNLILFAPTVAFIPEAQARKPLIKVPEAQTVPEGQTAPEVPTIRRAEIRKAAKRRKRKFIRKQARREARKKLNQNFGDPKLLMPEMPRK